MSNYIDILKSRVAEISQDASTHMYNAFNNLFIEQLESAVIDVMLKSGIEGGLHKVKEVVEELMVEVIQDVEDLQDVINNSDEQLREIDENIKRLRHEKYKLLNSTQGIQDRFTRVKVLAEFVRRVYRDMVENNSPTLNKLNKQLF